MTRNTANLSFYCRESKKNKDGKAPIELSLIVKNQRYTGTDGIEHCVTEIIASKIELLNERFTMEM